MKLLFYILFFSVFLSIGGNVICANTLSVSNTSIQNFNQKKPIHFPSEIQVYTLIDDSELDLEGESPIFKNKINQNNTTCFINKSFFFSQQSFKNSILFSTNYSKRFKNLPPFCGYITPNYFTKSILRI